jgi:hypothetical protein
MVVFLISTNHLTQRNASNYDCVNMLVTVRQPHYLNVYVPALRRAVKRKPCNICTIVRSVCRAASSEKAVVNSHMVRGMETDRVLQGSLLKVSIRVILRIDDSSCH